MSKKSVKWPLILNSYPLFTAWSLTGAKSQQFSCIFIIKWYTWKSFSSTPTWNLQVHDYYPSKRTHWDWSLVHILSWPEHHTKPTPEQLQFRLICIGLEPRGVCQCRNGIGIELLSLLIRWVLNRPPKMEFLCAWRNSRVPPVKRFQIKTTKRKHSIYSDFVIASKSMGSQWFSSRFFKNNPNKINGKTSRWRGV